MGIYLNFNKLKLGKIKDSVFQFADYITSAQ